MPGGDSWLPQTAVVVPVKAHALARKTPADQTTAGVASSAEAAPARALPDTPHTHAEPSAQKPAAAKPAAEPAHSPGSLADDGSEPAAANPAVAESAAAEPVPAEPAAAKPAAVPERTANSNAPAAAPKPEKTPLSPRAKLLAGALALLVVALAVVFFTRWLVTLGFMQDFLANYPGETHLPEGTEPGFPAWVQWQHFFNFFLIVLIIRSGWQVRRETRPPGYWTPRWSKGGYGKISINLWFHQSLDILWLLNGVIFVILLFVTGHWARLVPTTWEVFPNAASALIQYVSLDWPTENGWVNYNSLQQLAYFVTVFIAAPLAAITGVRMSGVWPKEAKTLNRIYPVEWARAIHFPTMLYFVVFIVGHVALVFATGALRNLNHMYGGQDAVNWVGFWIFFVSTLLVIGAWFAARPLILAPIAGLSGRVSSR